MKKIIAKFNSVCTETGKKLKKGEYIYYDYQNKKAYHIDANKPKEYNEAESIRSYIDAQECAMFERYGNY